jgi:hypothetical protein
MARGSEAIGGLVRVSKARFHGTHGRVRVPLSARQLGWAAVVVLGLLLLLRALELRLPEMTRPVWQDEVHHNEPVLSSPDMAALEKSAVYRVMFQPKLDFWLRHEIWFPLLGVSERALRIPALVWGLCLVPLVYAALLGLFAARMDLRWAALLAFLSSLWIVDNPMQVYVAAEARHYSLIGLASTIWCVLLFLYRGRPRWLLALASVLFANTHFFSLPLIALGYCLQIGRELRERSYRWIPLHLLALVAVYACTVYLNWTPFNALLTRPPGAVRAPLTDILQLTHVKDGLQLWVAFSRALAVPPATWFVWLVILVATVVRRQWRWVPLLVAVFAVLPAIFLYLRFRSSYPFGDRYFSPFFGFGLVTLVAGLDVVLNEWQRFLPRLSARAQPFAAPAAVVAVGLLFSAPAFAYRLVRDARNIRAVPANSSPYFQAYSALAAEHEPIFIVHTRCYVGDIPSLYFQFILPQSGGSIEWGDVGCKGSGGRGGQTRRRLRLFLRRYARRGGIVVIDEKETECTGRPLPPIPPPFSVERMDVGEGCLWKIRGAKTRAQLADVASALGVSVAPYFR